jgi:4-amino-4-deoxy-L-arabinose transferase-like glycosyltransferase
MVAGYHLVPMHRHALVAIAAAFALLSVAFNLTIPLFEAPDEQVHFLYVRHLATGRGLPRQLPGELESYAGQQSSQPPLYYALVAALTFWIDTGDVREDIRDVFAEPGLPLARQPSGPPARGPGAMFGHDRAMEAFPFRGTALAVHLGRMLSTLLGLVAIAATYRLARTLAPCRPAVAVAAAALLAFNPQFVFLSSVLNNDAAVNAASAVALAIAPRLLARPRDGRAWWALGLTAALATASKYSGLTIYGLAAAALLLADGRAGWRARARAALRNLARARLSGLARAALPELARGALPSLARGALPGLALPAVALLGVWVGRNQLLYGDPLGWRLYLSATGRMIQPMPLDAARWLDRLDLLWTSYWLTFGWMNVGGPGWLYRAAGALCLLAVAGWVALLRRSGRVGQERRGLALLVLWVGLIVLLVLGWIAINPSAAQGRLLFPAAGAIATLLALGLVGPLPRRLAPLAAGGLAVALLALDVWVWLAVLAPAYAA